MEGRTEKSKQLVELNEQMMDDAEQMGFAERKMAHLTAGTSKIERDAVLVVDKANAAAARCG